MTTMTTMTADPIFTNADVPVIRPVGNSSVAIGNVPNDVPLNMTEPAASSALLGTMTNVSRGVVVVRGGVRTFVKDSHVLQEGDHITVPQGGRATVNFPESATNKSPFSGRLTGGSDAIVYSTKLAGGVGMTIVNVDLMSGDFVVDTPYARPDAPAPTESAGAKVAASGGFTLGEFALGGLGVVALGAIVASSHEDSKGTSVSSVSPAATSVSDGKGAATVLGKSTPTNTNASDTAPDTDTSTVAADHPTVRQFHVASVDETAKSSSNHEDSGLHLDHGELVSSQSEIVSMLPNGQSVHFHGLELADSFGSAVDTATHGVAGLLTPAVDGILGSGTTKGLVDSLAFQFGSVSNYSSALMHDISITPSSGMPEAVLQMWEPGPQTTSGLLHVPVLTAAIGLLDDTPLIPVLETHGEGFLQIGSASPVTSWVTGNLATVHLLQSISDQLGGGAALTNANVPTVGFLPVGSLALAVDMLHASPIAPIASTAEGTSANGTMTQSSHLLHGLLV